MNACYKAKKQHRRVKFTTDFAVLTGNTVKSQVTETTTTPDPTSIEFERNFDELLDDGLSGHDRRLVLVIDNLDRVEASDARAIWSTLQTFLRDRQQDAPAWYENISFLVPFDPEGLRDLWSEPNDSKSTSQLKVQSFTDKSFLLRFTTPPPVLSDWRMFLRDRLREALPDCNDEDLDSAVQVFSLHKSESSRKTPTPREIKIYVNQIGTFLRQWQNEFAISSVAYFVLLQRDDADLETSLREKTIPSERMEYHFGEGLAQDLAGLIYNVPGAHGQQLLLSDDIANALFGGKFSSLQDLAKDHGRGFWEVLRSISDARVPQAEICEVAGAALSLRRTGWNEDPPHPNYRHLVKSVVTRFSELPPPKSLDERLEAVS